MSETTKKPVLETMHLGISFGGLHAACHLRAAAFRLRFHHAGRHGPSVRTRQLHYPDGTGPCAGGPPCVRPDDGGGKPENGSLYHFGRQTCGGEHGAGLRSFSLTEGAASELAEDDRVRKAYLGA